MAPEEEASRPTDGCPPQLHTADSVGKREYRMHPYRQSAWVLPDDGTCGR